MGRRSKHAAITDIYDLESPEATEFRRILHNLNESEKGGKKQAVLITSAMLAEGKSLVSSFMAMTAASHKKRKTLIIDFDLRRPTMHKLFGHDRENGVAEIILDKLPPRQAVRPTNIDNLDLLTAGKYIANPSELINTANVHGIIEEMRFYYDFIVVDSPPLIPVIDALILLDELDSVFLVVKAGATQRAVVGRARDLLAAQNGKVVGVVVNNLSHILPYYYNYNYYGYHYKPSRK